jgi:hypothetical protein
VNSNTFVHPEAEEKEEGWLCSLSLSDTGSSAFICQISDLSIFCK